MGRLSLIFGLLLALGLAASTPAWAQRGKIAGRVTDSKGAALPGANVIIDGTSMGAAADKDGYYFIINVPPGIYVLRASMIGYGEKAVADVRVVSDLTTTVNFTLAETMVKGETVVVEEYRVPAVQKDITYRVQTRDVQEIRDLPVTTVTDLLANQVGITRDIPTTPVSSRPVFGQFATIPSDGLHFRGGRSNETLYLFDGVNVTDNLWGGFKLQSVSELAFQSIETYTGTFGPQYGEAMSGVFRMSSLSSLVQKYRFYVRGYTDKIAPEGASHNTSNLDLMLSGKVPGLSKLSFYGATRVYTSDGYINGFIYPNYVDSGGQDFSGTPKKVPMQYRDNQFYTGKLLYQITPSQKLSVGGFYTKGNEGLYNHYFKYNPYGTPRVFLDDLLLYLKHQWVVSRSSILTTTLSSYKREFASRVFDNPEDYAVIPQNGSAEFSISGEDWVYFESLFDRKQIKMDLVSQVNRMHKLEAGLSFDLLRTKMERRNPDGFSSLENYDLQPRKYAAYLSDKMEFNSIGMILNLGLRFDYVDPNRTYVKTLKDPDGALQDSKPRVYVSPRLGISYPVSDVAAFHFGYGHYYQYPNFFMVFQGLNRDYEKYPRPNPRLSTGAIASPDIREEKTVDYEAGVQAKISNEVSLHVTGFYRKISNLIGTMIVTDVNGRKFSAFDNLDYATVKGIEITLKKRFSNHFSGSLNYTFSKTLVSTSVLFELPTDATRTFPADWDQPHVFSYDLNVRLPHRFGFSIFGSLESGLPYTFNLFEPNAERAPMIQYMDVLLYKDFKLGGFKQRLGLQVRNLPNRRNVWWVYADSGKPGVDANPATSDDYTENPAMYGPGRTFELVLSLWND